MHGFSTFLKQASTRRRTKILIFALVGVTEAKLRRKSWSKYNRKIIDFGLKLERKDRVILKKDNRSRKQDFDNPIGRLGFRRT